MQALVNRFRSTGTLRGLAATALLLALSGCAWHAGRGLKSCRYTFRNLAFTGVDMGASHWTLDVGIANPNRHEVTLTRLRYALVHEGDTLLTGENPEAHTVAAGDSLSAKTILDVPNAIWKRLPPGIFSQTNAAFTIQADAYLHTWVGDIVAPRAVQQTVHVDMTQQVARMKEMMLKKLFSGGWPGKHLGDGGIAGPDTTGPR